ncbi:hypothetical protein Nepgr_024940 [Nepenthes gracilis]|uniref:Uncharacterized protein n=1 Tax=Nepenthes gracilis TaxID=150966 RepID=A0AAD3XZ33_NEPGR|nr:hypothetical protein Nepgr_024940 [Nepenthes gracilis]
MEKLPWGILNSQSVNYGCALKQQEITFEVIGEDTVNKLAITFDETLKVKDVHPVIGNDLPVDEDDNNGLKVENVAVDLNLDCDDFAVSTLKKCLGKCATFPNGGHMSSKSEDGRDKTPDSQLQQSSSYSHSTSLPSARKLISAMKGSREKEGASPRDLNVSWAPDVWEPPSTSLSHTVKKTTQQQFKNNKKHGKGKHKGKNTRTGPKEKKHYRRSCGRSDWGLVSYADTDSVFSRNYASSSAELPDLDDKNGGGCADSSCGTSFLRKSNGGLLVAYAEAT